MYTVPGDGERSLASCRVLLPKQVARVGADPLFASLPTGGRFPQEHECRPHAAETGGLGTGFRQCGTYGSVSEQVEGRTLEEFLLLVAAT